MCAALPPSPVDALGLIDVHPRTVPIAPTCAGLDCASASCRLGGLITGEGTDRGQVTDRSPSAAQLRSGFRWLSVRTGRRAPGRQAPAPAAATSPGRRHPLASPGRERHGRSDDRLKVRRKARREHVPIASCGTVVHGVRLGGVPHPHVAGDQGAAYPSDRGSTSSPFGIRQSPLPLRDCFECQRLQDGAQELAPKAFAIRDDLGAECLSDQRARGRRSPAPRSGRSSCCRKLRAGFRAAPPARGSLEGRGVHRAMCGDERIRPFASRTNRCSRAAAQPLQV